MRKTLASRAFRLVESALDDELGYVDRRAAVDGLLTALSESSEDWARRLDVGLRAHVENCAVCGVQRLRGPLCDLAESACATLATAVLSKIQVEQVLEEARRKATRLERADLDRRASEGSPLARFLLEARSARAFDRNFAVPVEGFLLSTGAARGAVAALPRGGLRRGLGAPPGGAPRPRRRPHWGEVVQVPARLRGFGAVRRALPERLRRPRRGGARRRRSRPAVGRPRERQDDHGEAVVWLVQVQEMTRPLLVGEDNPHSADPRMALYPLPAGAAGSRLAAHLGLEVGSYLDAFDRTNLCTGGWNLREARASAERVLVARAGRGTLILLGARVCSAFRVPFKPFEPFELVRRVGARALVARGVVLPHPSGRCRVWNDRESAPRAKEAVARYGGACFLEVS